MAIDWSFWKNMQHVKLWQAAYLVCNRNPDEVGRESSDKNVDNINFVLNLLESKLGAGYFTDGAMHPSNSYLHEVRLADVAACCLDCGLGIPPELSALAKAAHQTEIKRIDWDNWLSRKHITFDDALLLSMGQNPADFYDTELFADEYDRLFKQAEQWIKNGELKAKFILTDEGSSEYHDIEPVSFFNLARLNNWSLSKSVHDFLDEWQSINKTSTEQQAEIVNDADTDIQESKNGQQRPGINGKRDLDAAEWYKTMKPEDVEKMTVTEIHTKLKDRDANKNNADKLWAHGFSDWNREQTVWQKKRPGKKQGK